MSRHKNEPGLPAWRGDALRLRRLAAGWTTNTLAERVGVSKSTIHRWEHGENSPTSDDVVRLATALDVPITVFSKEPRVV